MSFQDEREVRVQEIEQIIKSYLPEETGYQKTVLQAMNYSMLAGGKRLRPMLMQETYRMFGGNGREIEPFMAAIEMIHTYSLVHDDLPAMDNDEYRRGRKTTHVVYGEAMAILAGDGLLTYAFETAAKAFSIGGSQKTKLVGRAIGILAQKAGIDGMLGGQCVDVEAEDPKVQVDMDRLLYIHDKKTAAMIQSSMMIGAVLAGAGEDDIASLEKIGYLVGLAFQIRDDILDIEGTQEELGKPIGSDAKNHKATYVSLAGMEKAKQDVEDFSAQAIDMVQNLSSKSSFLTDMIRDLVYRTN
ncbi:MAG: polyprenyl synthetase family protein [Lachnospiraceae bacterium]